MYGVVIQGNSQAKGETVQVSLNVSVYRRYLEQQIHAPKNAHTARCGSQCLSTSQASHLLKQTSPTPSSTPNPIIHSPPPSIPNSPLLLSHELHASPPSPLPGIHTVLTSQTHPLNMPFHFLSTSLICNLTTIIRKEDRMGHSIRPLQRDRHCLINGYFRAGDGVLFPRVAKFV